LAYGGLYQATSNVKNADIYRWDFGDDGYSMQAAGNHYYYQPGSHSITMTATGTTGCETKFKLNDVFVLDEEGMPVEKSQLAKGEGLDENSFTMKAYPTVFSKKLTVEFNVSKEQDVTLQFIDQNGKVVYVDKIAATKGNNRKVYTDTSMLPGSGVYYFVKIISNELGEQTEKLIKL
jgi:PKD repeat protein